MNNGQNCSYVNGTINDCTRGYQSINKRNIYDKCPGLDLFSNIPKLIK